MSSNSNEDQNLPKEDAAKVEENKLVKDLPKQHKPLFFISGASTGADSIPFTIYKELNIQLKGYIPFEFARNDGEGPKIAKEHGFWEGKNCKRLGRFGWRDCANSGLSDCCVAFLVDKPRTGRGTLSTVNMFVNGSFELVPYEPIIITVGVNKVKVKYRTIVPDKISKPSSVKEVETSKIVANDTTSNCDVPQKRTRLCKNTTLKEDCDTVSFPIVTVPYLG